MSACRMMLRSTGTGKSNRSCLGTVTLSWASPDALAAHDSRFDDESRTRLSATHARPRVILESRHAETSGCKCHSKLFLDGTFFVRDTLTVLAKTLQMTANGITGHFARFR